MNAVTLKHLIDMEALVSERDAVIVANSIRAYQGLAMAYDDGHFLEIRDRLDKLAESLQLAIQEGRAK